MIAVILALALQAGSGCRSHGASVSCLLGPPVRERPAQPVLAMADRSPDSAPHHKAARRPAEKHRAKPKTKPKSKTPAPRPPLDANAIARHADGLVSIGDCTGVRTFLTGVGKIAAANGAFARCAGSPLLLPAAARQQTE